MRLADFQGKVIGGNGQHRISEAVREGVPFQVEDGDDADDSERDFEDVLVKKNKQPAADMTAKGELPPCRKAGAPPAGQSPAPPSQHTHTHLGAAGRTANKRPLLLQIHLGFLINLKGQGKREEGKQTSMNISCLYLRNTRKAMAQSPLLCQFPN